MPLLGLAISGREAVRRGETSEVEEYPLIDQGGFTRYLGFLSSY
jgi:hypothetical protein